MIECQGEQHFKSVKHFGGDAMFEIRQEHDRRKREYADLIGLRLVEVMYTDYIYDSIADFLNNVL